MGIPYIASLNRREAISTKATQGFTVLELMMGLVIAAILGVLLLPAIQSVRNRVEKVNCMSNLRNLSAAANLYIQQNGHWPQISPVLMSSDRIAYSKAWIAALEPMGISAKGWICPTVQHSWGGPDYLKPDQIRIDYIPFPFDEKQMTPYRWSGSPWFVENADAHGNGNLIIFTDGSIRELNEVRKSPPSSAQN